MQVDSNSVAIDNDFLQKALEMQREEERIIYILSKLFQCIGHNPVIHPLVFQKEVMHNSITEKLFAQQIIGTPTWEEIHQNNEAKIQYYTYMLLELYNKFWGVPLDLGKSTVFTYWKREKSLGEIHSLAMCLLCNCGMFLSDDDDSQRISKLIESYFNKKIVVYTRENVSDIARNNGIELSRSDLRSFAHRR